jgi:hypothetical protein
MSARSAFRRRVVAILFVCLAMPVVMARGSADPDVDAALKILEKVDGLTKTEYDNYKSALERYADLRQGIFGGMGRLVEANQPEVKSGWERFCDGGSSAVEALAKVVPPEKTQLKKFFDDETAMWAALKKVEMPAAEESETADHMMLETVTPALDKKMQEILDDDKKNDAEVAQNIKQRVDVAGLVVAGLRIANKLLNPNELLKAMTEEVLKNLKAYRTALTLARAVGRDKINQLKTFRQAQLLAGEIDKRVQAATEDMMRKAEATKSELHASTLDSEKAVVIHAEGWIKVMGAHFADTIELVKKFNETINGRLTGTPNSDTKAALGDYERFKNELAAWEEEARAIEEGFSLVEKQIDEFRDGDIKTSLQDALRECREIMKECASLRADIKSEMESALSDANLR